MAEKKKGGRGLTPISRAIPAIRSGRISGISERALQDAWTAYFGGLANYALPRGIENGTLDISVESSSALVGIRGLQKKILACFSRVFGDDLVVRVRFKVDPSAFEGLRPSGGTGEAMTASGGPQEPDAVLTPEMEAALAGNPELLEAFRGFHRQCAKASRRLEDMGWKPCRDCQTLTPSTYCPDCGEKHRQEALVKAEAFMVKCPWVSYDEISQRIPGLTLMDFISLRERKTDEAKSQMMDLYFRASSQLTRENLARLKTAASDYVLLSRGIDPAELTPDVLLACLPKDVCRVMALARR